jgi:hypothetical protein
MKFAIKSDIKTNTTIISTSTAALEQEESEEQGLRPYTMFKYSIRSELTQKYYERRLRKFFDVIHFEVEVITLLKWLVVLHKIIAD